MIIMPSLTALAQDRGLSWALPSWGGWEKCRNQNGPITLTKAEGGVNWQISKTVKQLPSAQNEHKNWLVNCSEHRFTQFICPIESFRALSDGSYQSEIILPRITFCHRRLGNACMYGWAVGALISKENLLEYACVCTDSEMVFVPSCVCASACLWSSSPVLSPDPSVFPPPCSVCVNSSTSPGWLTLEYLNHWAALA